MSARSPDVNRACDYFHADESDNAVQNLVGHFGSVRLEERKKIVAWLRSGRVSGPSSHTEVIADAIERGEYEP